MLLLLNHIGKLSGLMNAIFMPVIFYICWEMNKNFTFKKNTISSCGTTKESGKLFNFSLTFAGILQTIFAFTIIYNFSLLNNFLVSVPPIVAVYLRYIRNCANGSQI